MDNNSYDRFSYQKYIRVLDVTVYLFNIKIAGVSYPSRCWFSDPPRNNTITWGLETGTNLAQTSGSKVVTSSGALFKTRNIKVDKTRENILFNRLIQKDKLLSQRILTSLLRDQVSGSEEIGLMSEPMTETLGWEWG